MKQIVGTSPCSSECSTCCVQEGTISYCGSESECQTVIPVGISVGLSILMVVIFAAVCFFLYWKFKDRDIEK